MPGSCLIFVVLLPILEDCRIFVIEGIVRRKENKKPDNIC